jgi:hypothetical protein
MSTPDRWRERAAKQRRQPVDTPDFGVQYAESRYKVVRNAHDPLYVEPVDEEVRFDARFVIDALLTAAVFFLAIVVLSGMGPR